MPPLDHSRAPVLEALTAYRAADYTPFNSPGHKLGRGVDVDTLAVLGRSVFLSDLIGTGGLDDRRASAAILAQAQELMADAVGADKAFFSTCGSSLSVKSAILAAARPGEKIAVNRNAHMSVIAGLILSGADPVWIRPRWDGELALSHPPGPAEVLTALGADPAAVMVISPTDYGTCADLAAITEVCHAHDTPLLVDEAWGAHLPFHPELPEWAMNVGADLCVTSIHKMGAAPEQSSVFHLQGDRIDSAALARCEGMLGTTSPNVILWAAMDGWRRNMTHAGHDLLDDALRLAAATREALASIAGLAVLGDGELTGPGRAFRIDPLKIVIDVTDLGISGYQAADWLREHRHITVGLADHRRITAQLTFADDEHSGLVLAEALHALTGAGLPAPPVIDIPTPAELELELATTPREAFFARSVRVPAAHAVGRVAAETLTPYPPGVPAVLPGEVLNFAVIEYLRSGHAAGMHIPDASDPELGTILVLAD